MAYIIPEDYHPPFPFTNAHVNTFYPFFLRRQVEPAYKRQRLSTPDDDFFDVDFIQNDNRRIAILCHGLEGSSGSQYLKGTSLELSDGSWDIAAMNYRGCSGEPNNQLRVYHSGATDDLHLLVEHVLPHYEEIALVGFSLGGNLVLKYSSDGLFDISGKIKVVLAISAPTDLHAGSLYLQKKSNWLYSYRFLVNLRKKMVLKQKQFPDQIDLSLFKSINTLYDFDDYFTGPIHGFKDASDYYKQCSSGQFLTSVSVPTYIINALDDPFLPEECYPIALAKKSELLNLITPKHGGHVGFTDYKKNEYWEEKMILKLLNEHVPN